MLGWLGGPPAAGDQDLSLAFAAASDTVSTPTAAGAFPVGWSLPGPFASQPSC